MKKLKVTKAKENQRLDIFLSNELEISRSQAQKKIKLGEVLVNDKIASAHDQAQAGDKINIKETKRPDSQTAKLNLPKLNIIAETDDYLVINKPAGLIVHGGEGISELTLVDILEAKYPKIKKIGDDPLRPGIVHRLDKEASGLLVIAKTNDMFDHLKKQFQSRGIKKEYVALVYGKIEALHDKIDFPIARSVKGHKMSARPANQAGRRAITEFTVKKSFVNYTLLDVNIKTGRTHQIRVHFSAYGRPIVGDDLYGHRKTRVINKKLNLGRIFLHAQKLSFHDLKNELQEFKSALPKELKKLLAEVK